MLAIVITEAVAIALLGLLVAGLLRSHAEILRALHQLGAGVDPDGDAGRTHRPTAVSLHGGRLTTSTGGDAAHDLVGTTLDGAAVALAVTATRHDTLLAFLSSGCTTCQPFWSAFAAGVDVPHGARLVVVAQSEESESRLRRLAGPELTVVQSGAAWEAYGVPGSPHFVYVDGRTGRVAGEGTAGSWPQVADLLEQAVADRRARVEGVRADGLAEDRREDFAQDPQDNAERIDRELMAAGIGPGHASLFGPPDGATDD